MSTTYAKIATITVSSSTNSVTFSSIPSSFTDLVLHTSLRTDRADYGDNIGLKFNSSTSGYSDKRLYFYGSGVASDAGSSSFLRCCRVDALLNTGNTFSSALIYMPNYTGSNYKSVSIDNVQENNATTNTYCEMYAGLWSDTAAITSITLYAVDAGFLNFVADSTLTLYGIKSS